jgi:RNA polymerase sigma-70 factor, ECF subfamily
VAADTVRAIGVNPGEEVRSGVRSARWSADDLQAAFIGDMYSYISRRLLRREDAEDVTAEVFAAAFQALPKFKGQCEPRLWLLGIARRKVADAMRIKRRRPETLASEQVMDGDASAKVAEAFAGDPTLPENAAQRAEEARVLRGIIERLKPAWRDALTLHYADGLTVEEVAIVMRRSPGAINSLLQRARAAVYREGKAYFVDEEESGR